MVRKIFQNGEVFYAEDINQIAYPRIDGQDFIGHGDLIADANMSDAPENLKSKFYTWYNRFRVTIGNGRVAEISPGVIQNGGLKISFPASTFTIPANATGYLYIGTTNSDSTVAIRFDTALPSNSIPLAKVVTNATTLIQVEDIRDITAIALPPTIPQAVPVGTPLFSLLPPTIAGIDGYIELLENPRNVSRVTYSNLYSLFGDYYGSGDGLTTFGLPGIGGLFFRGLKAEETQGSIIGSDTFNILNSNLPSHSHPINPVSHTHGTTQTPHGHGTTQTPHGHNIADYGHVHSLSGYTYDTDAGEGRDGDGSAYAPLANSTALAYSNIQVVQNTIAINVNNANANISVNTSDHGIIQTQSTGDGQPVSWTPKSLVMRVFLKY